MISLSPHFKGDALTCEDPAFDKASYRWCRSARRHAKIIAYVKDAEDVVIALDYAKTNQLPIAIHCGGHNLAGASSIEDGLVIDLSRYMNGCKVDPENRLAYVGGGARLVTLEEAAIEHGLATVTSSENDVGVAGFVLGGGDGFLTGEYGMGCDNLVQATLVTADGSILIVNKNSNPDLFFAIRGGGSNFGVVTELVLQLHPQRRTVFSGRLIFSQDALKDLVEILKSRQDKPSPKEYAGLLLTVDPKGSGEPVVAMLMFYNGSEAEARAYFKEIYDLGPIIDDTAEIPFEKSTSILGLEADNFAYAATQQTMSFDYESFKKAHELIVQIAKERDMLTAILFKFLDPQKILSVPSESTAFRRGNGFLTDLLFFWKHDCPENVDIGRRTARKLKEILQRGKPTSLGQGDNSFGYANVDTDCGGDQDKIKLVFGDNYPRLQKIKKKYDPMVIFNRWYPIVPTDD